MRGYSLDCTLGGLVLRQLKEFFYFYSFALITLYITHHFQSYLPFWARNLGEIVINDNTQEISVSKFFILALGIILFRSLSRILFFYPARAMERNIRMELLQKLERTDPARYKGKNAGQIFQSLFTDISYIRAFIGFALLQISNVVIALWVLLPKLATVHPKLLYSLLPLAASTVIFTIISVKFYSYFNGALKAQDKVQNFIIESYSGKKSIKNFHAEGSFIDIFNSHCLEELIFFLKASMGSVLSVPLIRVGMGLSLLTGAYLVKYHQLGVSSLILLSSFLFLLLGPLSYVSWIGVVLGRAYSSWNRIKDLWNLLDKKSPAEALRELNKQREYLADEYMFKIPFWDKELEILFPQNRFSIIIGSTGCGKSTLLLNLAQIAKTNNKKISFCAQNPYIYNDTLERNIFLGRKSNFQLRQEAHYLFKLFQLDNLAPTDKLLSMELGENGKRVSGGQAQRICLIRSILSNADLFIWDDPFSAIDVLLERAIFHHFLHEDRFKNKTFILSGHRVTTVKYCHHIIYLDKKSGIMEINSSIGGRVNEFFREQIL